ncbi:MAG TPA: site-2 protease family protein [Cyclobacteriaceae bacterium]|nr:site-2 protease family protein [Cyclobacteriaceae bacterium]
MKPGIKTFLIHSSLFIVTFITTTLAGAEWTYGKSVLVGGYTWQDFYSGLPYAICFLTILTAHEFGHYFTAIYYKVRTSLPYFIPLPPIPLMLGTLGALIRLRQRVYSTKENFDIGIAGPLAGFVVSLGFLFYGFTHLPPPEYIFTIHPEYEQFGPDYANYVYAPGFLPEGSLNVYLGKNLLFLFFENFVADPTRVPNIHEIIHYPFLFAGFLSLIFTSINLLPIGQLDGGHVLYGLVGHTWHKRVASVIFLGFLFYAGLGFVHPKEGMEVLWYKIPLFIGFLYMAMRGLALSNRDTWMYALALFAVQYLIVTLFPDVRGYSGWLLFAFIIGRFVGIQHPPSENEAPLSQGRVILGWIALIIFIICFAPNPLEIVEIVGEGQVIGT